MSDEELDELAFRYAHDEAVLELIAENRDMQARISGLFDRLKLQAENFASYRQTQLKQMAKCRG